MRIKRAILAGHYAFSEKASLEVEEDGLTELDIVNPLSMQWQFTRLFDPRVLIVRKPENICTSFKAQTLKA